MATSIGDTITAEVSRTGRTAWEVTTHLCTVTGTEGGEPTVQPRCGAAPGVARFGIGDPVDCKRCLALTP